MQETIEDKISYPMDTGEFNQSVAAQRMATGMAAEAYAIADLYSRGYRVSKPFDGSSKYDLIVDRNGILSRLQVKAASKHSLQATVNYTKYKRNDIGESYAFTKVKYVETDFDFLVIVDRVTKTVYYVPVEDIDLNKAMFNIRAEDKEKYQQF